MTDQPEEQRFLTDAEAALLLGRSVYKVAEIRAAGKIPYLPGKPVLMERCDVLAFKAAEEAPKTPAQLRANARAWAERYLFKRRIRSGYFNK
ncbi:MAG: hypothetical protein Q8L54_08155 [Devosia sp.]|nr:hypothetical protein [Devosia sp.]